MIGLPEGELGASAADADRIAGVVVLGAHRVDLRIRDVRVEGSRRYTCAVSGPCDSVLLEEIL
jgi:hypothetical protein